MTEYANEKSSNMIKRLGNVLYWAGCIIAPFAFLYGFFEGGYIYMRNPTTGSIDFNSDFDFSLAYGIITGAIFGIPTWLIGLAARYILTGRGLKK